MARKRYPRYSKEKQQEHISRGQIESRFAEYGWVVVPVQPDLGEDYFVSIYFNGQAQGVNCYLQLKSIRNSESRVRQGSIHYDVKVSDLKHWEKFTFPVAIVVWDILKIRGWWIFADTAIKALETSGKKWRKQVNVRIEMPLANNSSNNGLDLFKEHIGWKLFPIIQRDKKFIFSLKEESLDRQREFKEFLDSIPLDKDISFPGDMFVFPKWFSQWFDSKRINITFSAIPKEQSFPIEILVDLPIGSQRSIKTRLALKKSETNRSILDNSATDDPLLVELVSEKKYDSKHNLSIRFEIRNLGKTVYEGFYLLLFVRDLLVSGGAKVVLPDIEGNPHIMKLGYFRSVDVPKIISDLTNLYHDLSTIQDFVDSVITIPDSGFSKEDLRNIAIVSDMFTKGSHTTSLTSFEVTLKGAGLKEVLKVHLLPRMNKFGVYLSESKIKILGTEIDLGKLVQIVEGNLSISRTEAEKYSEIDDETFVEVKMIKPTATFVSFDIIKAEAIRIAHLIGTKYPVDKIYHHGQIAAGMLKKQEFPVELACNFTAGMNETVNEYITANTKFPFHLTDLNKTDTQNKEEISKSGQIAFQNS